MVAKVSLVLEMDFSSDWNEGEGMLGGVGEMGDEVWLAVWKGQAGLVGETEGGERGGRMGDNGGSVRKGERGAGMAERWGSARSKASQSGRVKRWFGAAAAAASCSG